jgi:hypothetical protein
MPNIRKSGWKGYKSVDLFQNWETPIIQIQIRQKAKWYGELFAMTADLDEYYSRYEVFDVYWPKWSS